jgi:Fuc2NAc and GlcNAc transferase
MTYFFAALILSGLLTLLLIRHGTRVSRLDIPNERSSHSTPTPRGGGIAIVAVTVAALVGCYLKNLIDGRDAIAIAAGALIVALVGFLDDRGTITAARWRLLGHALGALIIVVGLRGLPALPIFGRAVDLGIVGSILAILYLMWLLNLFNFMDGIDGITGTETLVVALCGAFLTWEAAPSSKLWIMPLALAGAAAGFLFLNWSPAKIFLGDVGSGFIGIVMGALSLQAAHTVPRLGWCWVILMGVFIVDTSVTLFRRSLRRERLYIAHRNHAYQHLAIKLNSHATVSAGVGAITLLWLLPIALAVERQKIDGFAGVLIAYAPLVVAAIALGAGRQDS